MFCSHDNERWRHREAGKFRPPSWIRHLGFFDFFKFAQKCWESVKKYENMSQLQFNKGFRLFQPQICVKNEVFREKIHLNLKICKHASLNDVTMTSANYVCTQSWYQNEHNEISQKVTKFSGCSSSRSDVIKIFREGGLQKPPPPPSPNRVKEMAGN